MGRDAIPPLFFLVQGFLDCGITVLGYELD